ncbi:DinB family protein [Humibacter ginsenosidimutans]|uniref:DinB family protein n=1 Tax=Humibacter ginsenosidimutans TaxID=2599293 RepID=A0A5B8M0Q4_9MICO|nr:DinB family protein [Humibacter ginsenosidimutans]QDZ13836.1 DinB family protein [Humibacter ginsenosidimutans]
MTDDKDAEKAMLLRALQRSRDALLWKLDGLSEQQARLPMTRTGTNLLGLVKHVATTEYGYFTEVFGRPAPERMPWAEDETEDNADMWATSDQSIEWVTAFAHRAQANTEQVVDELDLDARGVVPWWPEERRNVTLRQILVHMINEAARHAGHADIVRELIDGAAGIGAKGAGLPEHDEQWWERYRARLQEVADGFGD